MHITFVILLLLIIAVAIDAASSRYYSTTEQYHMFASDKTFSTSLSRHQDILQTLRVEAQKKFFTRDFDTEEDDFKNFFIYEGYLMHPDMVMQILKQSSEAFQQNPVVIEELEKSNITKQFINFDNLSLENFFEAMESKNILLIEIETQPDNLKHFPMLADQKDKTLVDQIRLKYQLLLMMFVYKRVNPKNLFTIDKRRKNDQDSTDISNIIACNIWALDRDEQQTISYDIRGLYRV